MCSDTIGLRPSVSGFGSGGHFFLILYLVHFLLILRKLLNFIIVRPTLPAEVDGAEA